MDSKTLLKTILVYNDKFSIIADMIEIFDPESVIKFLHVFAGQTIHVPSIKDLEAATRDIEIYSIIKRRGFTSEVVSEMSQRYDITYDKVEKIYKTVSKFYGSTDMKVD